MNRTNMGNSTQTELRDVIKGELENSNPAHLHRCGQMLCEVNCQMLDWIVVPAVSTI